MRNYIGQIVSKFARREIIFPGERGADAREMRAAQEERWVNLLNAIHDKLNERKSSSSEIQDSIRSIANLIRKSPDYLFRIDEAQEKHTITGILPILDRDDAIIESALSEPYLFIGAIVAECIYGLYGVANFTNQETKSLVGLFDPRILVGSMNYISRRDYKQNLNSLQLKFDDLTKSLDTHNVKFKSALEDFDTASNNKLVKHEDIINEQNDKFSNKFKEFDDIWNKFNDNARSEISAIRALARENETLKAASDVWSEKHTKHRAVFSIGLLTLIVAIFAASAIFVTYLPDIITNIPRKQDNDVPYGYIVLLFVPVIAIAWVLRILGRLITNALSLGEDAEQRRALLETYFQLVGNPDAKMDPSDRILVLNAIFRPLPGHQTEDVAPPNLVDLAKGALGSNK